MARTNGLCEDCLAETPTRITRAVVVDHITPLAHGGSDEDENTRNLCADHDRQRTAEQFGRRPIVRVDDDGWPVERHPAAPPALPQEG